MQNYTSINKWAEELIAPVIEKITKLVVEEGRKNNANLHCGEWWAYFVKNTSTLFSLLPIKHASCQIGMTLRLLMEIASDVNFIAKYPKNIANLERIHEKVLAGKTSFSFLYLSENSHKYKLYKFKNGKIIRNAIQTKDRIKLAYGKNGDNIYSYLNYYVHLNYMGAILDLVHSQAGPEVILKERLNLLQFYPQFYEMMVHSIGELLGSEQLRHYDCSNIYLSIEHLCKNCKVIK